MSRLDINALNEYSRKFADLLFASYPEWIRFAEAATDPTTQQKFLQVEVPAPPESCFENNLYVLTADDEITIGVGEMHWHLNELMMPGSRPYSLEWTEYQAALEDVEHLLTEEKVIYLLFRGGTCIGGGYARRAEIHSLKSVQLDDFLNFWKPESKTEVRIRSWRGSLNTDYCVL